MLTTYLNTLKEQGNFTFDDIENLSGIPKDTIKNIFSGKTKAPGTETLAPIVYAMGGSLDAAFGHGKKEDTNSLTILKELYENHLADVKEHYEHRLAEMKEHYNELKENNAAMKERHEERIAEINEHIETIKLDKRWFRIATCASVVALVAFCMLEILTPGMGWLRY
jgi:transcriptional regulator with XRE-family HTH domain